MKVTKERIGLKEVDVLHARFENARIDYFLDRKTHLPIRIAVFHGRHFSVPPTLEKVHAWRNSTKV